MAKKKHTAATLQEFLEHKKEELTDPKIEKIDWELAKQEWIKSVNELYHKVDEIIVKNLKKAGFEVKTERDQIRLVEDFIGSYFIDNYIIQARELVIQFTPISGMMIGYKGRVDMMMPRGTVKLILTEDNKWAIADKLSVPMILSDFNEKNIQKEFEHFL